MTTLSARIVELSPTSGVYVVATGPDHVALRDPIGTTWVRRDGTPCEPPGSSRPLATAWLRGLADHPAPDSVSVERWKLAGHVARAQAAGDSTVVDLLTGVNEVRSLWWCDASGARRVRGLEPEMRVEVIGPNVAVVLDPAAGRLERIDGSKVLAIELPSQIASDLQATAVGYRVMTALPEIDALVIAGKHSAIVLGCSQLGSVVPGEITWQLGWTFPRGDRAARAGGTVTMSAWGRTNIDVGGRKLSLGATSLTKGESVTLVDLLWDALGSTQYRWVERADGTRLPLPGAPSLVERVSTQAFEVTAVDREVEISPAILRAVEAMRAEGLLGAMTPALLREHLEDVKRPELREILFTYYQDQGRAKADRYLSHDWRFGQETDDVIAELSGLLDGTPLFTQVSVGPNVITVQGAAGVEEIDVEDLDDVVAHFNQALRMRKDEWRIIPIMFGDDRRVYMAMRLETARRLVNAGVPLAVED